MRINIYSQELTKEVAIVEAAARDTGTIHFGVRLYLHSPQQLHSRPDDDDRSAVTLWVPEANSFTASDLEKVFIDMADRANRIDHLIRGRK